MNENQTEDPAGRMIRGVLVTVTHQIRDVEIPAADTLSGLYEVIGAELVEKVSLPCDPALDMWCDEEGLLARPALRNPVAEYIAGYWFTHPTDDQAIALDPADLPLYVGDVVFLGSRDGVDGDEITDVPEGFASVRQAAEVIAASLRGEIRTAS